MSLFSIKRWSQSFLIGTADEDFPLIFLPHFLRMAKKRHVVVTFQLVLCNSLISWLFTVGLQWTPVTFILVYFGPKAR